jgi:hypothetical protein
VSASYPSHNIEQGMVTYLRNPANVIMIQIK